MAIARLKLVLALDASCDVRTADRALRHGLHAIGKSGLRARLAESGARLGIVFPTGASK
jgi:hypothetical protein